MSKINYCFTLFFIILSSQLSCGGNEKSQESNEVSSGDFETLEATIKMKEIPEMLRTKDVSGPNLVFVSIWLDSDNNSEFSEGDISLRLAVIKSTENGEESIRSTLERGYGATVVLADIEYNVIGDELTFTVEKNQSELLEPISSQTQIYVNVGYFDRASTWASADYLPSELAYTQVQNNTRILDDKQDSSGTDDFIDIHEFRLDFIK